MYGIDANKRAWDMANEPVQLRSGNLDTSRLIVINPVPASAWRLCTP